MSADQKTEPSSTETPMPQSATYDAERQTMRTRFDCNMRGSSIAVIKRGLAPAWKLLIKAQPTALGKRVYREQLWMQAE